MSKAEITWRPRSKALREDEPGPVRLLLFGAVLGALAVPIYGLWEGVVLAAAGITLPSGEALQRAAILHALLGGVFGATMGMTGLKGVRWLLGLTLLWIGFVASGKLGLMLADVGGFVPMGLALGIGGGFATGFIFPRSEAVPVPLVAAVTGMLLGIVGVTLPVNLHLLPGPFVPAVWMVLGLGIVVGLVLGGLFAMISVVLEELPAVLAILGLMGAAGAGSLFVVQRAPAPLAAGTSEGPPVLLIVVDGLRADHVFDYDREVTPELDRLAKRSTRFTDATATSNWVVPSLASILTGTDPHIHGAGRNDGAGNVRTGMRLTVPTMAEVLGDHGYATVGHTPSPWLLSYGLDRGFQRWHDDPADGALLSAEHPLYALGLIPEPSRPAEAVVDEALTSMDSLGDRGWFLLVHLDDPARLSATAEDEVALGTTGHALTDRYDAAIYGVDRQIRRLVDAAPKQAIVTVVGSHGLELQEGRPVEGAAPRGLRHGHSLFQEQVHVPLLVRSATRQRPVHAPVGLAALAPTILHLTGVEEGRGLPRLTAAEPDADATVLASAVRWGPEQRLIRSGPTKLIARSSGRNALFRVDTDPNEATGVVEASDRDQVERELLSRAPPVGAASLREADPLALQLGSLLQRFVPTP